MGDIELWISLNATTIVATLLLAMVNHARMNRAQAKLELPASEPLRLLRIHNYKCAQDDYWLNVFILGLGLAMVAWAMTWGEQPVEPGILWGTGAFTVGWSLWSFRGWQSWRRLDELTKVAEAAREKEVDAHE